MELLNLSVDIFSSKLEKTPTDHLNYQRMMIKSLVNIEHRHDHNILWLQLNEVIDDNNDDQDAHENHHDHDHCYHLHLEINLCFEGFIVDHTGEHVKSVPMLIFSMTTTAFTMT